MPKSIFDVWNNNHIYLMAICNATPDSFSDGGKLNSKNALEVFVYQAMHYRVDIIDIGGESTRPGSLAITADQELDRVLPVIDFIRKMCSIPISIDTYKSKVAKAVLDAGAEIVNDISAGVLDPKMFDLVAKYKCPYIMMHMRGNPQNMSEYTHYNNLLKEISDELMEQINKAKSKGIDKIIIDPGIGFAKTKEQNAYLIANLSKLKKLNIPILLGASRKSFLSLSSTYDVNDRDEQSLVAHTIGLTQGARIIRSHNLEYSRKMIDTFEFINQINQKES
jgi:dihydropteroate synthase